MDGHLRHLTVQPSTSSVDKTRAAKIRLFFKTNDCFVASGNSEPASTVLQEQGKISCMAVCFVFFSALQNCDVMFSDRDQTKIDENKSVCLFERARQITLAPLRTTCVSEPDLLHLTALHVSLKTLQCGWHLQVKGSKSKCLSKTSIRTSTRKYKKNVPVLLVLGVRHGRTH